MSGLLKSHICAICHNKGYEPNIKIELYHTLKYDNNQWKHQRCIRQYNGITERLEKLFVKYALF